MKRRTIISIIITIVTIILTNKYWLVFKPMPVDFDIFGKGHYDMEVQLNKKDNDNFDKIKSQTIDLDLKQNNHASFHVKRSRFPKRIRFVIVSQSENYPITIKNINLHNGKTKLEALEQFSLKNGKLIIKDNALFIYPEKEAIILTYNAPLKARTTVKFDFKLFVIITVLSFLLFWKISNYIAEFKTTEEKSRIEIIFLTIFFVFLFVPMSCINQDEKSKEENRMLAKWQPLIKQDCEINYNFGKDFNEWFNDRFYLRQKFINFRNSLTILIANKCDKGIVDKSTQITYPNGSFNRINIKTVKDNFKALYVLNDYCKQHNIRLYVLIVPNKADIHTTKYNIIKDEYKHNDFLNYIHSLQKENKIKIIYPYEKMKKAADAGSQLYFKTEHHWTDDGAFIGYQELMQEIRKDYPSINTLTADDFNQFQDKKIRGDFSRKFNYGQDCWIIGLSESLCKLYHKYDYTYYKHKDFDKLDTTTINMEHHYEKLYRYDKGANYRVIQLGTSQNENLTEFIPFTFKNVKRIRNNGVKGIKKDEEFKIMKYYEKEILDYKPDILIFCITYNNIASLHKLFKME